jgi:hypothetical protein
MTCGVTRRHLHNHDTRLTVTPAPWSGLEVRLVRGYGCQRRRLPVFSPPQPNHLAARARVVYTCYTSPSTLTRGSANTGCQLTI